MLCREMSLVKDDGTNGVAIPLLCRSWGCAWCRPIRQRQLVRLAESGTPNRFVTLTSNPSTGTSPAARAHALAVAWRLVCKRWRRANPEGTLEFLAVFEATKAGEPHLHILCRSGYIDQRWLSRQMKAIANAPIVDVRKVTNASTYARYIAKYVGKTPQRFGTCKRYWVTPGYAALGEKPAADPWGVKGGWVVDKRSLYDIWLSWTKRGRDMLPERGVNISPEGFRSLNEVRYGPTATALPEAWADVQLRRDTTIALSRLYFCPAATTAARARPRQPDARGAAPAVAVLPRQGEPLP